MNNDVLGKAIWSFHKNPQEQELLTWTHLTEEDPMPVSYFFRSYEEMPELEQKALNLAFGSVLDVGCGAGSHSLYAQNFLNLDVTALDLSPAAAATSQSRGVQNVLCGNIFEHQGSYDTVMLLMNGVGMCETIQGLQELLVHLKKIVLPKGQILLDSSDLIYLFEDSDGPANVPQGNYYGEVDFGIRFLDQEAIFPWLYVDFETLKKVAQTVGYQCQYLMEGTHYDYLARLTRVC